MFLLGFLRLRYWRHAFFGMALLFVLLFLAGQYGSDAKDGYRRNAEGVGA
jgi:hypothetical protein